MNLARYIRLNNFYKYICSSQNCATTSHFRNISNQQTLKLNENVHSKGEAKDNNADQEETTHFGFESVKASEKDQKVHKVFENVANSYDLMNDLMSAGIHRVWKDMFMERLGPVHGMNLLDMAGGTGDIAFRYLKYLQNQPNPDNRKSHLTIADINEHMLGVGKKRAEEQGLTVSQLPNISIEWKTADAQNLPFENETFNAYTIAFGIRNCTHIDKVLCEAHRVLKPGGRFLCLEFSQLTNSNLQWLYDQYSFQVIPPLGQIITGKWQPYKYLVESIRQFPKQDDFKKMIEDAGFELVQYENLTFGVVSIHSGFKL